MIELQYRTADGRMVFKIQAESQKEVFQKLYEVQSVFEADALCGLCQSPRIQCQVRTIDDNKYYSLICAHCGAELHFGQHKKGATLFAKKSGPANGWKRYQQGDEQQGN